MFVYLNVVANYIVQLKGNENHAYSFLAFWELVPGYLYFPSCFASKKGTDLLKNCSVHKRRKIRVFGDTSCFNAIKV